MYLEWGFQTDSTTGRVAQEFSRVSSYEVGVRHSKAILNQLHNFSGCGSVVSVNKLPPEIPTRIFKDVVKRPFSALAERLREPSISTFPKEPILLTQVCSYWRWVALNTAVLWSHLDINPRLFRHSMTSTRSKFYIGHSADALLHIHLAKTPKSPHKSQYTLFNADPGLIKLLTLTSPRMQSLSVDISQGHQKIYRSFLAACFSHCTPGTLTSVSIRPAQLDCGNVGPFLVQTVNLRRGKDTMMGLPSETVEAVWHAVKVLRLKASRLTWGSKAYCRLIERRLVGVGTISQIRLGSILHSSPQLRVLELDLELKKYTPGDSSIAAVRLDDLEVLIMGGCKHEQLGSILQLIAPGSSPLSLSLVNPYLGSSEFISKDELAKFVARSNIAQLCTHEVENYSQLVEVFSLMPCLRVVAINALGSGKIEEGSIPLDFNIDVLYVINCCSLFSRFTSPQLERFVEEHDVQKLVLWQYDFRYCGLSENEIIETIPDNLYTVCPVVHFFPSTDPNPILDWFED